jgi:protoheme IX farnesyltransferase
MGAAALVLAMFSGICLTGIVIVANADRMRGALGAPAIDVDGDKLKLVVRDYLRVTKPAIMTLLLTTTLGSMLVAAAGWPGFTLVGWTLLGGALASGGASALNCYLDRDIDQVMARTRKRPIPTGTLSAAQVRNFALILSVASVLVLTTFVNPLAALLAVGGNLFYVIIYTIWLKRATPQNIVIGGAAGSFPPLVGWAAVTGSLGVAPLLIAAIIFYWTPPHFWSLALLKANDYRRAGVPMLPVSHGEPYTRRAILLYSLLLVPITLLLAIVGPLGYIYLIAALLLGAIFLGYAAQMYREDSNRLAWRLFKYSNYYLALLLAVMVLDAVLG